MFWPERQTQSPRDKWGCSRRPVVNFSTTFYKMLFCHFPLAKKWQSQTVSIEKLSKTLLLDNAPHKMLMKLTPCPTRNSSGVRWLDRTEVDNGVLDLKKVKKVSLSYSISSIPLILCRSYSQLYVHVLPFHVSIQFPRIFQWSCGTIEVKQSFHLSEVTFKPQDEDINFQYCHLMFCIFCTLIGTLKCFVQLCCHFAFCHCFVILSCVLRRL